MPPSPGQDARGAVFFAPHELPDLFQAGVIAQGAVIETLVALLEYGSFHAAVNSPGGMVVDLCLCARRPHKNLQREGMVAALVATGHVPLSSHASGFFQERMNLRLEEVGVLHKMTQEGSGLLYGSFRRELGEHLQPVRIRR